MVAVAYDEKRWSFTRSSNYRALTDKVLVFWINGRVIGGGRLREVVAQGSSTVYYITITFFSYEKKNIKG